ncbi:MAG: TlpA disulfide reductase family protein [Dyadobacter sp.]|uniref:TlpA family protein disulfide reductase n=1 Tax=Dyadobacter sp. TaxID=1914288 RepID=UPI0032673764
MSYCLKSTLVILISVFAFACHDQKDTGKVKISVKLHNGKGAKVDLISSNILSFDTIMLGSVNADTAGRAFIEIALDQPVFANIQSNDEYIQLLLIPGDIINIEPDSSKKPGGLRSTGDGATVHQYLEKTRALQQKYEEVNGKPAIHADLNEFIGRRDALRKGYDSLYANLSKDQTVSKLALQLMAKKNQMAQYFFHQNYISAQYDFNFNNPEIPATLKTVIKDLPDDSLAMAANMYEYGQALNFYLQADIFQEVGDVAKDQENDSLGDKWPTITNNVIKKRKLSPRLDAHFRAANLNYYVNMEGIYPELQTIRADFNRDCKVPAYKKAIDKSFAKWEAIGPGKPAPDFTGQTADGKKVSLSSLKGKVVYVDVWATWCVPCREEFPDSKKLVKQFEGNDQVVFLYVSVDRDVDAWKKLLKDNSIPAGSHINEQTDQPGSLWEKYHLWGIPRYILINSDGTMLETHAPRPSSGKAAALIKSHLKTV